ncbi:hypothetical protein KC356_g9343 [Hortaea werneckii]|nr:hypothetical protein KC356_g9343 [Hortaea werneckii]
MLTQTLPTFGTPYPSEPASSLPHHQSATYVNSPSTPPYPPSLNPSSPLPTSSTPTTTTTNDAKIPHLPPELWLQIFPSILSSPKNLTNLHLVCRAFHSLLVQHEGSLVREVMRTQTVRFPFLSSGALERSRPAPPAPERRGQGWGRGSCAAGRAHGDGGRHGRDFPLLLPLDEARKLVFPLPSSPSSSSSSVPAFTDLWSLHYRLARLEECEEVWRRCVSWGPEFAWEKRRWEGVHSAGTLALVRLRDVGALGRLRVEDGCGQRGEWDSGTLWRQRERNVSI